MQMDKKTIIESGLLEQYLLGDLSVEEQAQVERGLQEHSDLRDHYDLLQEDFRRMAFENAIEPPAHLKNGIEQAISQSAEDVKETPVIPLRKNSYRFAIAASLAGILLLSTVWMYTQWQDAKDSLVTVENETNELRDRIDRLENNYSETQQWLQAINQPNTVQLTLAGNDKLPEATAITFINHDLKTVVLNPNGLPDIGDDRTFQMWADVEGEMIDMGVIPKEKGLIAMKYIEHAESVNITIEPAGGSDHPTVEQLISNAVL